MDVVDSVVRLAGNSVGLVASQVLLAVPLVGIDDVPVDVPSVLAVEGVPILVCVCASGFDVVIDVNTEVSDDVDAAVVPAIVGVGVEEARLDVASMVVVGVKPKFGVVELPGDIAPVGEKLIVLDVVCRAGVAVLNTALVDEK